MNTERAIQVMDFIEAEDLRLEMEVGLVHNASKYAPTNYILKQRVEPLPPCNTVGCYAGFAVQLFNPNFYIDQSLLDNSGDRGWPGIRREAMVLLDMTIAEAERMFHISEWDSDLRIQYRAATQKKKVALLRQQLERVIRGEKTYR